MCFAACSCIIISSYADLWQKGAPCSNNVFVIAGPQWKSTCLRNQGLPAKPIMRGRIYDFKSGSGSIDWEPKCAMKVFKKPSFHPVIDSQYFNATDVLAEYGFEFCCKGTCFLPIDGNLPLRICGENDPMWLWPDQVMTSYASHLERKGSWSGNYPGMWSVTGCLSATCQSPMVNLMAITYSVIIYQIVFEFSAAVISLLVRWWFSLVSVTDGSLLSWIQIGKKCQTTVTPFGLNQII